MVAAGLKPPQPPILEYADEYAEYSAAPHHRKRPRNKVVNAHI